MIDLLNMSNEEYCKWLREEIFKTTPEYEWRRRFEEYQNKIKHDFQEEWDKKKCKWFFPKYRRKKLRAKIIRRYSHPIFSLIEDTVEEMLPKAMDDFFDNLVDIKDVPFGDKNYFIEEN